MLSSVFLYTATTATTTTTTPILILPLPITTAFIKLPPLFPPLPHPKRWFLFFFSPDSPFSLSFSFLARRGSFVFLFFSFCVLVYWHPTLSLSLSLSLSLLLLLSHSLADVAGRWAISVPPFVSALPHNQYPSPPSLPPSSE